MKYTTSGVRLRSITSRPGILNWLFLPGGPGIGAESLIELIMAIDVPGTCWLVDLPGDGSNVNPTHIGDDPYANWPHVLVEAAQAVEHPVYVGHSTGGMYLLSVPDVEPLLEGMALVDTAPDSKWFSAYVAMTEANPLTAVAEAAVAYEADPTNARLADLTVASAPWNFTPDGVAAGTELLGRMPYNRAAVEWSDAAFDHSYQSTWWPETIPTLLVAGKEDRIVDQSGWDDPHFYGANIIRRRIPRSGHFPWIENPTAVRDAFAELSAAIANRSSK